MDKILRRYALVLLACTLCIHVISGKATDSIFVREYDTAYLSCPMSPVYSWQVLDTKRIVIDCNETNKVNPDVIHKMFVWSDCQLGIYNFNKGDPKVFQCFTTNGSFKIYISFSVPPTNMRIQGANEKNEVYGIAGKPTTISCRVNSGKPLETMTWIRNDEVVSLGGPSVLNYTFFAARSDDMAILTCSANNTADDTSISKHIVFRLLKKPVVMLEVVPESTVLEGEPISLLCKSTLAGGTVNSFEWTHDGLHLQIYSDNFSISDTRRSDAGPYSCIGRNMAGYSIDNVTVIVKYAPVVKNNSIVFILDEITRNLKCEASGVPRIYTYKQWQHVTFDGQLIRYLNGNDDGTLLLPYHKSDNERYQDVGIYVCTVSNNVPDASGKVWQTGSIHVTIKGNPVLARLNESTVQFGNINSTSNIVLNIMSSTAISKVTWYNKDNQVLKEDDSCNLTMIQMQLFGEVVSISGHRCSMTITKTKPEDFQNYTIKVVNQDGWNYFQVVLKSASPPNTPEIISLTAGRNEISVDWIPKFDGGKNQSFIVQYRKKYDDLWRNEPVQKNVNQDLQISYLYNLQPDTEYEIRMFAFNNIGRSNATNIYFVKTKEKATDLNVLYTILGLVTGFSIMICAWKSINNYVLKANKADSSNNRSPERTIQDNAENVRIKRPNGKLNYVDVVIGPISSERRFYIHGADDRTPYADIDFDAKVYLSSLAADLQMISRLVNKTMMTMISCVLKV